MVSELCLIATLAVDCLADLNYAEQLYPKRVEQVAETDKNTLVAERRRVQEIVEMTEFGMRILGYKIKVDYDNGRWIGINDELGLVIEAESKAELKELCIEMMPDLIEKNIQEGVK